ncbi:MAG: DUF3179 domain-containing (seleno)protein [Planctomycetota bacterium]
MRRRNLSGYTYRDPARLEGRHAFVLWDRDTESPWWPVIGRSVSGPLVDVPLSLLDEAMWEQATWAAAVEAHPEAEVLAREFDHARPASWPRLSEAAIASIREQLVE